MSNPVHKNREKFNRPATHNDKKKETKKGYKKHGRRKHNDDNNPLP